MSTLFAEKLSIRTLCGAVALAALSAASANPITGGSGNPGAAPTRYDVEVLVSNNPVYKPFLADDLVANAWGISLRPAGLGGHWWINNAASGTVTEYVGDVGSTPLFQDALKTVVIAQSPSLGDTPAEPTGIAFSGSNTDFLVTHAGPVYTAPSRFVFCTTNGTISGWGEHLNDDGSYTRALESVLAVDNAEAGASYFGCAVTQAASGNRLYAADFGRNRIDVFDAQWQPITVPGGFVDAAIPSDYYPWNIQTIDGSLFVAYARYSGTPGEELHGKGFGRIAEFDLDGNLVKNWDDAGLLNAPWGFAVAPADFGDMSGKLLVSDFGDGRVTAFDRTAKRATGYLLGHNGKPVSVGGIWGIIFGNGASLGEHNHLYFGAGPRGEVDGIFGKLVPRPGR